MRPEERALELTSNRGQGSTLAPRKCGRWEESIDSDTATVVKAPLSKPFSVVSQGERESRSWCRMLGKVICVDEGHRGAKTWKVQRVSDGPCLV
jgi:hypothetical protein